MSETLLEVRNIRKYFDAGRKKSLKAVDGVSFSIQKGETFGLVGESGCGKTTIGRLIVRLYEATGGSVFYKNRDIKTLTRKETLDYAFNVQMIFQDPYASLDPRMTVESIIAEGMRIHRIYSREETKAKVYELLATVGLSREHAQRFPHEFSGGQRQRVGIARALAVNPELIVCDEPVSALDVSIQAQIINLLRDLQRDRGLTYLFIAHDLSLVKYISDRIGVMYLGALVEVAAAEELYRNPMHPYTRALLSAIPVPDPIEEGERQRILLTGDVPSPINTPEQCKFCTRCAHVTPRCLEGIPPLVEVLPDHWVACAMNKELNIDAYAI
ncbi:MAG: ABC transporter ATP-binding protein [Oscillospiraceae bacterium]|jgi:oligopeptide transport system ATP-binding protein|nr:ABC transporter ATP-binding protein [Oscillospiraceae bacterium]